MSHVDDGALHAYLDGALDALPASEAARIRQHLATCSECAGRLEEERALREEAAAILAGADPGVGAVPPLEELRQRAASRARVGSGFRLRQLTWAASLVLAVGAGWMLRGSRDPRISQALDPLLREAVQERAAPATVAEEEAAPAPVSDTTAVSDTPAMSEASALPKAPVAFAPGAGAGAEASVEVSAAAPRLLQEQVAGVAPSAALPRAEAADVAAPSVAVTPEARAGEVSRAMMRPQATMVAEIQDAGARRTAAREGAIAVPGLPVLSVETGRPDLPAGTLRVLQLLEADTLELLHLPAGADPSAVSGPGDAWRTEVAVRYGAGWLVGRAHASAEVIEALLARVTGGG